MTKAITKLLGILVLVVVAFMLGANQYRMKRWPFDQGLFKAYSSFLNRASDSPAGQQTAAWIENLKKGGYILYFRHAHREKWGEAFAFDYYEFASHTEDATKTSFMRAVCLSEEGVEQAKLIGRIFQLVNIPTGVVVSSPSCRAKQTAVYAFGKYDYIDKAIQFSSGPSDKNSPGTRDSLITLLQNVEIRPGTNTIISGHGVDLSWGRGIEGKMPDSPPLMETGFHVIERQASNKLAVVFTFKSITDFATNAILPQKE
jgi:hypothetical protein